MTADQIKTFRTDRKLSQADLAEHLGVDQATVSRIERGAPIPGPVEKLLERLMAEPVSEVVAS
jgi:transcriptional regulator with XRE-family HTH domain